MTIPRWGCTAERTPISRLHARSPHRDSCRRAHRRRGPPRASPSPRPAPAPSHTPGPLPPFILLSSSPLPPFPGPPRPFVLTAVMGAARPPCQPLAAFAPPAGPVAVPALRSARLCCRARVEGAVAPPPPFRSAARAATVSSFASNGWAAGGGRARPRPMPAVGPPAAPSRCGARSLRAALVNKKGAGAEESLGIPSAPAESELVPGDIPTPPPPRQPPTTRATAPRPPLPRRGGLKRAVVALAAPPSPCRR